jgi:uncharacterized membrane protein
MLSMLAVQITVALATALARSESEDGSPGTSLAVGILVPMFGLGLNGLWCAFHGVFPPRPRRADGVVTSAPRSTRMRTMAETATEIITIDAPHERVWQIAIDLESYPMWAHDIKDVNIRATDDEGRPLEVEFRASALGRSTHYTLKYDYTNAPARWAGRC